MSRVSKFHRELERSTPLNVRKFLRYPQAAVLSGLPLTKLEQLVATGRVRSAKIGRTRLIDRASLEAVLDEATGSEVKLCKKQGRANGPGQPNPPRL